MIEQVLLPNKSILIRLEKKTNLVDKERAIAEAQAEILAAEMMLNALISEGYVIIERTPIGYDGVNLVLYKADKPQRALTPENLAKAGPPPEWK